MQPKDKPVLAGSYSNKKMKCPKCGKKMKEEMSDDFLNHQYIFRCYNKRCWFYGIERKQENSNEN
jgi:hypothetical protein